MSFAAILAILGPLLLPLLSKFLPAIVGHFIENWLSPPSPLEIAKAGLDEDILKGNLTALGTTTNLILDSSGQNKLTTNNLNNMLELLK